MGERFNPDKIFIYDKDGMHIILDGLTACDVQMTTGGFSEPPEFELTARGRGKLQIVKEKKESSVVTMEEFENVLLAGGDTDGDA